MFPQTNGVRVLTAAFPVSLKKASLRVGIAFGAWKVAATYAPDASGQTGSFGNREGGHRFLFSPASETKYGTLLSIATDATDDLRVVAVDARGKKCCLLSSAATASARSTRSPPVSACRWRRSRMWPCVLSSSRVLSGDRP